MDKYLSSAVVLGACLLGALPAWSADPVKIGFITTLSGPLGYAGQDALDGFRLAIEDGKLGGVPVRVLSEDDGFNPSSAKRIVDRFLKNERVRIVTGVIGTNVSEAVVPDVLDAGAFFLSSNAGPDSFAGKSCNKNYFVVSWQAETMHEASGQNANRLGYKRVFVVVANFQAGKDAVEGFKRSYKGAITNEIYARLDQTDFSAEIAQIRSAKPDAIWTMLPGGLGINFFKQYGLAGLGASVPAIITQPPFDLRQFDAVGDAMVGARLSLLWNYDFVNPANKEFVRRFVVTYKRMPTNYASQAYDTAMLMASALKAVGGDVGKADAFRTALRKADFQSVRGKFKFGQNQHPVQDLYTAEVTKDSSGKIQLKTDKRLISDYVDPFAKDCRL